MDTGLRGNDPVKNATAFHGASNANRFLDRLRARLTGMIDLKNNFTKKILTPHMQMNNKLNRIIRQWIPASAGMTEKKTGMTEERTRMTKKKIGMTEGGRIVSRKTLRTFTTRGVAFAMVLMMALSNVFMANAATYTFTQTDWSGGVTANTAVHDSINNLAQQNWLQFATSTSALETGATLAIGLAASSTTQTNDGTTITGFNLSGSVFSQTAISGAGTEAAIQLETIAGQFGSGADGDVTITTAKNINTDTIKAGRTCADGIAYNVVALPSATSATLSASVGAGCLAANDKVLLINLQGTATNYVNVGNYEVLTVATVSGTGVTFSTPGKTKTYGDDGGDTNIGTGTTNQRVIMQRVPQYGNITIGNGGSLTASAWNGTTGGVLVFYANGTASVTGTGSMTMSAKGYRRSTNLNFSGESYGGLGSTGNQDKGNNLGGGGFANDSLWLGCNIYGFGGGFASIGGGGSGNGGAVYGDATMTKLFMGSAPGYTSASGTVGNGAGIIYIIGNTISITSGLANNGGAGGGAGGSVYLSGNSLSVGSDILTATGGVDTAIHYTDPTNPDCPSGIQSGALAGSDGRVFLQSNDTFGTTSPTAETGAAIINYTTSGTFTSGVMDIGLNQGYSALDFNASTSTQTSVTVDVRAGDTATPDGTWTAWQTSIASGGSLSALGGARYVQYRANLATNISTQTPSLNDVTFNYSAYSPIQQSLTSSKYDTSSDANVMGSILWDEDEALPAGSTLTVSLRTAASAVLLDSATWYNFTSASTNCTKVATSVTCPSAALSSASATLTDGANDQWYQYKTTFTSNGGGTVTLPNVSVQYVVNAPPEIGSITASQIATSSDADWGNVQIAYSVRDIDTETGSITPGYITPSFEYNIGGGWIAIASATLSAGDITNKIVTQIGYTPYIAIWNAKSQIPEQYAVNAQIRITANDNEAANNIGQGTSAGFELDTAVPVISGAINGTSNEFSFTVSDDQLVSYRISNNADQSYDSVNASSGLWIATDSTSASATTSWNLVGAPDNQVLYFDALDSYGNTASTTVVGPATPTYFDLKDASNVLNNDYRIFLSWKVYTATTSASFNRYEVYRATDGFTYGLRGTVTNSATNYYTDTGLSSSTTYYYKMLTVDGDGDVSPYSSIVSHMPSGQGGTDLTPPALSLITTTDVQSTYAKVTFTTNELAFGAVDYAATGDSPYGLSVTKDTIATDHSIVLTNLNPNTTYTFRAKGTDIAGNVTTDDNAGAGYTFTTRGGPIITDVTAILTDDRNATIAWNTNVDSDSALVYAENASALTTGVGTTAVQDTSFAGGAGPLYQHKITLTNLTPRTTYYYYVQSTDSTGDMGVNKNGLNYYTVTTSYDTKPPIVSSISTPVITETAIVVLWKTDELSDSRVSYSTSPDIYTETTALDTNMSIMHAVTLSGLTGATDYYYVVHSSDPAGNATTSSEQIVTTANPQEVLIVSVGGGSGSSNNLSPDIKDTTPAAISNIAVASTTAFSAVLAFETSEPTVIGLRYGRTTAYDRAEASIDWKRTHEIHLYGLRLGTEYHYQIKAIDKGGNETFSDDLTFTTKFIAEVSETARTLENLQQYEQEIEDSLASILPSILPPFVEEARVTDITESTATINWRTNINSYATLAYSTEADYLAATTTRTVYTAEVSDITTKTTDHSLTLIGLKPNTTYHFKSKSFSVPQVVGEGRDMTFTTRAPAVQASVIDVKTSSFRAAWTTEVPASSIVEYKNLTTGVIERIIKEPLETYHDILVEGLRPGTRYEVKVLGYTAQNNLLASGSTINVLTSTDISAPKISNFKVDGALVPGRTDRIQTIVSWTTDEPGTGIVEYQEGAGSVADGFANKVTVTDSYVTNHVVILANLKPGTIYQFKITSADQAGNTASFGPRTIITPQKGESIFDVIFKNFEDTFKFLRGAGQ